ncbi:uncharacterized protein LOC134457712 [Engraulis encrasicolus]|uniref:uncharacterized protein LOC134457712 n=1 Tax=Engraulis encrasicolus TaxID=184585 RepID=UPI002FD03B31
MSRFFKKMVNKIIHDDSDDDSDGHERKAPVPPYHGTVVPHPNFNAHADAAALRKAIDSKDVDEDTILEVVVRRTNYQRQQIKAAYQQETGKPLEDAMKSALRSDFEDVVLGLLMTPAQYDAHELKHAMKGIGTCECILIEILTSRSNEEIRGIKKVFKEAYDESLEEDIKNDTDGHLQEALLALCKADRCEDVDISDSVAKSDAKALHEAGENKMGTDTSVFIDIFTSRSEPQLHKVFKYYGRYSEVSLAEAVDEEHTGDIDDCLTTLVKCAWNKPAYFAEKLHLAMKGWGANEETLTRIIVSRSEIDLKKILVEFKRMFGRTLQDAILKETKGHFEKILLGLCGKQVKLDIRVPPHCHHTYYLGQSNVWAPNLYDTCSSVSLYIPPRTLPNEHVIGVSAVASMGLFSKLFKKVTEDKSDQDDDLDLNDALGKKKAPEKPPYYGTVTPHPNFSAIRDAAALQKAIEAKGVDEATIIDLLVKRTNEQRQQIKAAYELDTKKPMEGAIKSALRSDLEDVVLALLMTPAEYDAHVLKHAMQGLGTHEDILTEIMASRSNKQISEIKKVFNKAYNEELEEDIKNDTSGDFLAALLALCKANRIEDSYMDDCLAKQDAKALYEAGEKQEGTDIAVFIDIFTSRSGPQLTKIFRMYSSYYGEEGLAAAVEKELKGDIEDCLVALLKCAWNTPAYFAEKLHLAMEQGMGTNKDTLTRIIVSRSELDLKKILKEYQRIYGPTLQESILAETKGDYEKILLGLCGDV